MLAAQNVKMLFLSMEASRQIRNVWFTWDVFRLRITLTQKTEKIFITPLALVVTRFLNAN